MKLRNFHKKLDQRKRQKIRFFFFNLEDQTRSFNIGMIGFLKENRENGGEEIIKEIISGTFPELKK